jgi:hypothetical protein
MSLSSINISQKANLFAIGYEQGFAVYNLSPVVEIKRVEIGSIKHVAIYNRSNIIALVGDNNFSKTTFDSGNIVHIWDDNLTDTGKNQNKSIDEPQTKYIEKSIMKIEFKFPIMHIEFCGNYFIVVLKNELYLYEIQTNTANANANANINQFVNLEYYKKIETYNNPYGLFSSIINYPINNYNISSSIKALSNITFITLGTQIGQVYIYINNFNVGKQSSNNKIINSRDKIMQSQDRIIQCHKNDIVCLALNNDSTMFATVSSNGTNIQVYKSNTYKMLYKFHRGYTSANITSIAFSRNKEYDYTNAEYLACTSNFSLHIFKLDSSRGEHSIYTFDKPLFMKTLWITSDEILNICSIGSNEYIEYLWIKMKLQENNNNQTTKKSIILDGYGKLVKPDINNLFRLI